MITPTDQIRITMPSGVTGRLQSATRPSTAQVADARMVVVDLLGTSPALPLDVVVDHVCQAYESPGGERLAVDLPCGPGEPTDEQLATQPALRHVLWVRATRDALHELTGEGAVRWSLASDDPDDVDVPELELSMSSGTRNVVAVDVGARLPDGRVWLC